MEMTHFGYAAYATMVIAIYSSPLTLYLLYRGWKNGSFIKSLVFVLVALPIAGTVAYIVLRLGVIAMAELSRL